jgi:hypothetical protein
MTPGIYRFGGLGKNTELLEEKYEWSSIGKQLRQKGLVK